MRILTTLAALLLVSASVYATGGEKSAPKKKIAIVQNMQDKYKLVYLDKNEGPVKITIYNKKGAKIHTQKVTNENGFSQQFDFTSLPVGQYTFEVIQPDGSQVIEVVEHGKGYLKASEVKAGVVNVDGGKKFRLAVVKYNEEPVYVKIYDSENRLVHDEVVRTSEGFRKVYDLANVNSSSFKFEVKNNKSTQIMVTH